MNVTIAATHSLSKSNFDKICRICLITTENPIRNSFKELLNKLQDCIGIKLEEDLTLPNAFCGSCANTINVMYNFKELCIYSQQILSDILRNELVDVKDEPTSTVDDENPVRSDALNTTDNKFSLDPLDIKEESIDNSSISDTPDTTNSVKNSKTNEPDTPVVKKQFRRRERFKCHKYWCNRYFRSARTRDNHMRHHIPKEERYHRCSFQNCKRAFAKKECLIKHEQQHHTKNEKEQCNICGVTVLLLRQHMLLTHSDRPYQCKQCTSKFVKEYHLRSHVERVHEGKGRKSMLCEECGKTFPDKYKLNQHINIHTGEKPYTCAKCPYAAKTKSGLVQHVDIHHNENRVKKFACTFCDKKFGTGNTLRSHIRSHTGERPYACKLCDKRYTQRASLRLHFKTHQLAMPIKTEMVKTEETN